MTTPTRVVASALLYLVLVHPSAAQPLTFDRHDYDSDAGARAIVAADFNRDGWMDVAQANTGRNSVTILFNQRGERFVRDREVAVGAGPFALAAGDLDRNGIPDLAVANADGNSISILLGQSNGTFTRTDLAAPADNPRGVTIADVNRDGRPDVVYTGYATGRLRILLGDGAGGFTQGPVYSGGTRPQGVAVADLNHDGLADFIIAAGSGLRVLRSVAGGGVVVVPTAGVQTNLNVLAVGDVNNDGAADVVAVSTSVSVLDVYLGDSTGRMALSEVYGIGTSPRGVVLADVNQDGLLDAITANRTSNNVSVLLNNPAHPGALHEDVLFTSAHGSRAVVAGDFDRDGRVDIATGNELAASMTVLSNVTDLIAAGFSFPASSVSSSEPLANEATVDQRFASVPRIETADFDHDGTLDFVLPRGSVEAPTGVVVLLHNGRTIVLTGTAPGAMTGFRVGDFNGDGNPDVVMFTASPEGSAEATRLQTFLWAGSGFTRSPVTTISQRVEWCSAGDLDRDTRSDLVCANLTLLGKGDGTFRNAVAYASDVGTNASFPGPLLADLDRDGALDIVLGNGYYHGDGAGGFEFREFTVGEGVSFGAVSAVADMNRDGWPDLIMEALPDAVSIAFGSASGFQASDLIIVVEDYAVLAVADMNLDGIPDIVVNGSVSLEGSGVTQILFGDGTGGFTKRSFTRLGAGPVASADLNSDGLPDLAAYDAGAVHLLVNSHNETNHPPVLEDYSVTAGYPCVTLDARVTDADSQSLTVEWFDSSGAAVGIGYGDLTGLATCVTAPGTYRYVRRASDGFGGVASAAVLFTYQVTLEEIVLYAAAENVTMTGNWSRVADATAAGGMRAYDRNAGAPKVAQPSESPANAITVPFVADPNLTYKLWIRLKADGNSWANDSVWVQFTGNSNYTAGNSIGLAVSLEECVNCGVSGWGWQDDGYGAPNKNGVRLKFDPGPQSVVIQTREDGVSIDQVILSAKQFLTQPPGPAKNDQTILPATRPPQ